MLKQQRAKFEKDRISQILELKNPPELDRLKEHFALRSSLTPAEVAKCLIAAAGDVNAGVKPQGNRPNYIPPVFQQEQSLTPEQQGAHDAKIAMDLGLIHGLPPMSGVGGRPVTREERLAV
jgi:hypothetical protein